VVTKYNLGVIPYYSLGAGFLTGKYRSEADLQNRARGPVVQKYLNERGLRILEALDAVAAECNSTPAKAALAWLMARPSVTAPIASATDLEQLEVLMTAADLRLSSKSIRALDEASAELPTQAAKSAQQN
jgi:aryl-alcohol dehydrogenase (NADP+)